MEGFCRGCLIKYDDLTELLQYTEKNRRLFVYSTGLQVKRNDAFTFQLCKDCYVNMKLACKFKKQCRSSDKKFKSYQALNEAGETVDFCTFLKNNDEYMTFRFPMTFGNSTPANQKAREEDNESTCTSIRNFMRDIMQNEEIPETEARIIQEVIEEEAEVLDDSLDSRWLQDDVSIDTDFQVDFSFSGFSTPHSINNDHCYTPKRLDDYVEQKPGKHDMPNQITEKSLEAVNGDNQRSYQAMNKNLEIPTNIKTEIDDQENYYTTEGILEDDEHGVINVVTNDNVQSNENVAERRVCTIDKNIERALKDNKDKSFCLDDLLNSPQVYTPVATATPTINNILFGDKLDLDNEMQNLNTQKIDQFIEQYRNISIDSDILADFFVRPDPGENIEEQYVYNDEQFKAEDIFIDHVDEEEYYENEVNEKNHEENGEPSLEEVPYDITNLYCNICKKQYASLKALKIHLTKKHSKQIVSAKIKTWNTKMWCECEYCGKQFSYMNSLKRHIKCHKRPEPEFNKGYKCEKCALPFSSQHKLDMHMTVHTGLQQKRNEAEKKYICDICGAKFTHTGNLNTHKRRHMKTYSVYCDDCGKGFVRRSELVEHMRQHTGIQPYFCRYCTRTFKRRDQYIKHTLSHTGEKPHECDICKKRFLHKNNLKAHITKSQRCMWLREKISRKIERKKKKNLVYEIRVPVKNGDKITILNDNQSEEDFIDQGIIKNATCVVHTN